jgi:hypothetical protein
LLLSAELFGYIHYFRFFYHLAFCRWGGGVNLRLGDGRSEGEGR